MKYFLPNVKAVKNAWFVVEFMANFVVVYGEVVVSTGPLLSEVNKMYCPNDNVFSADSLPQYQTEILSGRDSKCHKRNGKPISP